MDWITIIGLIDTLVSFEEIGRGWLPVVKNILARRKIRLSNWDSSDPVTQHLLDSFKSKVYAEYKEHIFSSDEIEEIIKKFLDGKKHLRLSYKEKKDITKYIRDILGEYNEYTRLLMSPGERV